MIFWVKVATQKVKTFPCCRAELREAVKLKMHLRQRNGTRPGHCGPLSANNGKSEESFFTMNNL